MLNVYLTEFKREKDHSFQGEKNMKKELQSLSVALRVKPRFFLALIFTF